MVVTNKKHQNITSIRKVKKQSMSSQFTLSNPNFGPVVRRANLERKTKSTRANNCPIHHSMPEQSHGFHETSQSKPDLNEV